MKRIKVLVAVVLVVSFVAACAAPAPEVIEREVIVEKEVPVTVEVVKEEIVEKEVIKTVEVVKEVVVEKVITATPEPEWVAKQGGTLVMGYYQEPEMLNMYIATQTVAGIAATLFQRSLLVHT